MSWIVEYHDGLTVLSYQNYDLSVSEAPRLFSDAEFEAVRRIRHGLEVLILRKRLQVCIAYAVIDGRKRAHGV